MVNVDSNSSVDNLKQIIVDALNETKVLDGSEDSDPDIAIPKPSFEVNSDDESDAKDEGVPDGAEEPKSFDKTDIRLALPVSRTDLDAGWTEIPSETTAEGKVTLETAGVVDQSVVAFAIGEEEFAVEVPIDDYNE